MTPDYPVVEKAYAYATRERRTGLEVLVFDHPAADGGPQIPKGTVDEGETPAEAVVRELEEESGVSEPLDVVHLETDRWLHEHHEQLYRRHFFHVPLEEERDAWDHRVTGDGEDDGMVFSYYWVVPPVSLAREMDAYLHALD
ncbi:NUDIX hydrolase [Natrononativus amylolyticus]|uniref:NUDIX hydrolase n=1 Tax=Natrononativus amylolyticus TaxID=2963434 RepID=UPI0020CC0FAA|nr:NUDIX domain-containing protein [Natrononativus amylolyticus]